MVLARAFDKTTVDATDRETARLAALEALDLLDSPRDDGFDRLVRLIKSVFNIDIGLVTLVDAHRQWYKACSGLAFEEVPRQDSFCKYVVDYEAEVVVPDATKDPRFAQHPAVTGDTHIRFYAGVPLQTREGHIIGTVCAIDRKPRKFDARELAILNEMAGVAMDRIELLQSASTDSLTNALTRRAFKQEAEQQIASAVSQQHDLSAIVLDIDHFKSVNDSHGHAAGDQVLKAVAAVCQEHVRDGELFGRLGGEEFVIVLPRVDRDLAIATADRIRAAISELQVACGNVLLNVTASFGISSLSVIGRDIDTLLAQADAAMYQAKHGGRNRCIAWSSLQGEENTGSRRRVLKAGSIHVNGASAIDCTVRSLGPDSAALSVSSSADIPSEFVLMISGEAFETSCKVIAQDRFNIEVMFR